MSTKPYLSVIIPVYNEISRKPEELKTNLEKIGRYLGDKGVDYEVVIVDDGSTDGTGEKIKQMKNLVNNLQVLRRVENKGKWFSVREGFGAAKGDYRLFTDADGSTDISNLDGFWKLLKEGHHVMIGSRDLAGSRIDKRQPRWKETLGHWGSALTRLVIGLPKIKDTQCGFKILSEEAVNKIVPQLRVDRWGGDFELLVLTENFDYKIVEVPVVWVDTGKSLVGIKGYLSTLKDLLEVKWWLVSGKYK